MPVEGDHHRVLKDDDGHPIEALDEWTRPKQDHLWKRGRSAMDLAGF